MFDLGFMELLVVGIIGLLVLGPERLPGAVRAVGLTIGRIKRGFADVQAQVEREIGADEIRQQLHNENIMKNLARQEREQAGAEAPPGTDEAPRPPLSNVRRSAPPAAVPAGPVVPDESAAVASPSGSSETTSAAAATPDAAPEQPVNRPHER